MNFTNKHFKFQPVSRIGWHVFHIKLIHKRCCNCMSRSFCRIVWISCIYTESRLNSVNYSDWWIYTDTPANVFVLSLALCRFVSMCVSAPLLIYNCYHPIFNIFITVSKFNAVCNHLICKRFEESKIVGAIWFAAMLVLVFAVVGLI